MVVFENKSWTMVPDFPCSKYDSNAPYWVEDNSEIANFIINSNGHFKITKTDETGKILSIEEYYSIEELKENKKQEINQTCSSLIYSGYDYNGEHYDLFDEDQINMLAWSSIAQQGKSVPYHSSGNPCRIYTSEEFLNLVAAITSFKTYNLTYCNLLKQQVNEMTNPEEVKAVVYGTTKLNEKYQEIMNSILGGQNETIS
jgi:hypothetical protein